ncbi:MAG TPA: hypothetical protein VEK34_01045 [Methylocella sp.]|nr:hypothetical protein [Methylocella sp.]
MDDGKGIVMCQTGAAGVLSAALASEREAGSNPFGLWIASLRCSSQ